MDILYLTLKKKWFDMIAGGEKPEEYREIKPYWTARLEGKRYDAVHFRNGYNQNSPTMLIELDGISRGVGNPQWGAPTKPVYILQLGKILEPPK